MVINELGLVQVYTGTGKGKTTASLGLAFRALGHGFKVKMLQFAKGSAYAGELYSAQKFFPNLTIQQFGRGCPYSSLIKQGMRKCNGCGECFLKDKEKVQGEEVEFAKLALKVIYQTIKEQDADIMILDEIGVALKYSLVTVEEVLEIIKIKPEKMELVLTGRGIPQEILDEAHLVTELQAVKHPFQQGIPSRRGIEY